MAQQPAELDVPALDLPPVSEKSGASVAPPATTEKRGSLFGGAATEEALASSRKVLSYSRRGADAFTGQEQKRCTKCGELKPLSEFHQKRKTSRDSRCKKCKSRYDKSRYGEDKRRKSTDRKRLLRDQGLCISCGTVPVSPQHGKVRCVNCMQYSRDASTKHRRKARNTLFEIYGGPTCACCGEGEERFLTFDHVNEDGAEHRLSIGKRSSGRGFSDVVSLHRALKQAGYPPVIQVLCFNCNMGKHLNGGVCPHEGARR